MHARAGEDGEPGVVRRNAEDVTVNQLPTRLFLRFFSGFELVIHGNIAMKRSQHDERRHHRQEEHNHHAVDDGKPVNFIVCHQEIRIPTARPPNVTLFKQRVVRVHDFFTRLDLLRRAPLRNVHLLPRIARFQQRLIVAPLLILVIHAEWLAFESNDSTQIRLLILVIQDREANVIIHVRFPVLRRESHWISAFVLFPRPLLVLHVPRHPHR